MKKTIKNIGLDVHKNSISIGIAHERRDGDVRKEVKPLLTIMYCVIECEIGLDRY